MENKLKDLIKKTIKTEVNLKHDGDFYGKMGIIVKDLFRMFGKKEDILLDSLVEYYNEHPDDTPSTTTFVNLLLNLNGQNKGFNPNLVAQQIKNGHLNVNDIAETLLLNLYSLTKDDYFIMTGKLSILVVSTIKNKKLLKDEKYINLIKKTINEDIDTDHDMKEFLESLINRYRVKYEKIPTQIIEMIKDRMKNITTYRTQVGIWFGINRNYNDLFDLINNKSFRPLLITKINTVMVRDKVTNLYGYVDSNAEFIIPTIFDELGTLAYTEEGWAVLGHIKSRREGMEVGYYRMDGNNGELLKYWD